MTIHHRVLYKMEMREFIAGLNKALAPVYILTGTDDYQKREALAAIRKKVFGDTDPGMNLAEYSAADDTMGQVIEELKTFPMFTSKRLVVLDKAEKVFSREKKPESGEEENEAETADPKKIPPPVMLENYGKSPSETAVLVLIATEEIRYADKFKSKFSKLFPLAPVLAAKPLGAGEAGAWMLKRAEERGIKIAPDAAATLKEYFGSDLSELETAVEKLATLAGKNKSVGRADVEGFIRRRVGYNVFQFTDSIGERKLNKTLEMAGDIFSAGLEESDGTREHNENAIFQRLLPMVAWEFKKIHNARIALASGKSEREVIAQIGGSPYGAKKTLDQARNYTLADCRAAQDSILDADNGIKTGLRPDLRLALEECLIKAMGRKKETAGRTSTT